MYINIHLLYIIYARIYNTIILTTMLSFIIVKHQLTELIFNQSTLLWMGF